MSTASVNIAGLCLVIVCVLVIFVNYIDRDDDEDNTTGAILI